MACTDYKKWDKMAAMLDDDGDEEELPVHERQAYSTTKRGPVRITRLDNASTVTIGKAGDLTIGGPSAVATAASSTASNASANAPANKRAFDYSKWDAVGNDLSDSEQDDDEMGGSLEHEILEYQDVQPTHAPQQRVPEQRLQQHLTAHAAQEEEEAGAGGSGPNPTQQPLQPLQPPRPPPHTPPHAQQQEKRGTDEGKDTGKDSGNEESLTRNGGSTDAYLWSQDRKEVVVSIYAPPHTRANQVQVTVKEGRVRLSVCGELVLEKEAMYPIEAANEPEDLDWCLADHSSGRRLIRVTLIKGLPGSQALPALPRTDALVLWWKGVFKGDAVIDVACIPDRNQHALAEHAQVWKEAHDQFRHLIKNVWKEAHAQFRDLVKNHQPMEI